MPQEIRVLRCFKCKMYQVDIVKKAKKWQCKMCQEKQSVFKEFFRGSGAECRQKAQELNLNANSKLAEAEDDFLSLLDRDDLPIDEIDFHLTNTEKKRVDDPENRQSLKTVENKWNKFVDPKDQLSHVSKRKDTDEFNDRMLKEVAHASPSNYIPNKKSKWSSFL